MRAGNVLTLSLVHIINSIQFTELNFRKNKDLCLEALLLILITQICSRTVAHERVMMKNKTKVYTL